VTAPYYGKRNPGSLTAAAPGDTLFFNFGAYNDSGDSEVVTGFAITDLEVIKNGIATVRATDSGYSLISDTGMVGDRAGLYRCSVQLFNTADDAAFYAVGGWYQAFVDSVTVDGKTVRFWLGSWEIGFDITAADTGINDRLGKIGFDVDTGLRSSIVDVDTGLTDHIANMDTGARQALAVIQSDVDTGLRSQISDVDTGLHSFVTSDTGLRPFLNALDTGIRDTLADYDTGIRDFITDAKNELDTGGVNVTASVDTGVIVNAVWNALVADHATDGTFGVKFDDMDTGIRTAISQVSAVVDTGVVNQAVWQGNATRTLTALDVDTGLRDLINDVKNELDTGLRDHIDNTDTGLRAFIDNVDTGLHGFVTSDTGLRPFINAVDTGLRDTLADYDTGIRALLALRDTGAIATAVWAGDTGLRDHVTNVDTGLTNRLSLIAFEVDTGLRASIADADTGIRAAIAAIATDTGLVANASAIRLQTDKLLFDTGNELQIDIRRVNNITVVGTGDTGTGDTWRPQ
jgi:hypothetical protein